MVDTVKTTMGNDNDDWEVAVDTGEFDKRLEQHEQDRTDKQVKFYLFCLFYRDKPNVQGEKQTKI